MESFKAMFVIAGLAIMTAPAAVSADTVNFFSASQSATVVHGSTSDTLTTAGYVFTYTLDNLFTGGVGLTTPIGRQQLVQWPGGLHAQAITTGPIGPASLTVSRTDGATFDLTALTFQILGNTWATNAELEIAPILNGNDGPHVFLDATGVAGNKFSYSTTLADWRGFTTTPLTGYDTYSMSLFTDFALLGTTLSSASPSPVPAPPALWLLGSALGGLTFRRRRV